MEDDILNLLDSTSEEPIIKLTQKLIRKLGTNEEKSLIEEIKKEIIKYTEKKSTRIKELYTIDKHNNIIIDKEKIDFALKLIKKDKEIYSQIESIKSKQHKEETIKTLIELKNNIEITSSTLKTQLESINTNQEKKSIFKKIFRKKAEPNNIEEKLDKIINTIEHSKHPENIQNINEYFIMKETFYSQENIKDTIDMIYKKCRIRETQGLQELNRILQIKYKNIIKNISKKIEELTSTKETQKKYDQRLVEYVYNKPKNYITQAIDHSSNDSIFKNIIIILSLIYELEETNNFENQETIKNTKISTNILKYSKLKLEKNSSKEKKDKPIKILGKINTEPQIIKRKI